MLSGDGRLCLGELMSVSRSQPRGSLLIEILLGMSLLMIAVMAIFALFPAADRAVVAADRSSQAHLMARRLMDAELKRDYGSLDVGMDDGTRVLSHSQRMGTPIQTTFHYSVTVTIPDSSRDLKKIEVRVSWEKNSDSRSNSVVLESLKGRLL